MIITFCGHSNVPDTDTLRAWLCEVMELFLREENVVCYLGGYGEFDNLAASVVREKQKSHSALQAVLIIPYLDRKYDERRYDYTLYPPLESVPLRYAIAKRNEWMAAQADVVIAYVTHSWGGAAKMLNYARVKQKKVIRYPENPCK